MSEQQQVNLTMIRHVAEHLGDLCEQVVFLGGAVTELLLTDTAAAQVRFTEDVDVVVSVGSYAEYARLEEALRVRGFTNARDVICRWNIDGVVVDVMPTDELILGFGNRWYAAAMEAAVKYPISTGFAIRLVTAPFFVATKLEAFGHPSRVGHGDYVLSRDMVDIITVVDGRPELVAEVGESGIELREFLSQTFQMMLLDDDFREALMTHLKPDDASQQRLPLIVQRLEKIAGMT